MLQHLVSRGLEQFESGFAAQLGLKTLFGEQDRHAIVHLGYHASHRGL